MSEIEKAIETLRKVSDIETSKRYRELHEIKSFNYDLLTAIEALQEKAERENPKPLITNDGLEIMLCPHCKVDLMGEFSEPDEREKYCPFCGGSVDFSHAVNDFVNVNKNEHIGEAANMVEGE